MAKTENSNHLNKPTYQPIRNADRKTARPTDY